MKRLELTRPGDGKPKRAECTVCGHVGTYPAYWNLNRQGKCQNPRCNAPGRKLKVIEVSTPTRTNPNQPEPTRATPSHPEQPEAPDAS